MKFLIIGSFYIGTVFFILYFFSAAHYSDKPGIKQYRENIDSFYDKLKLRLSENSIKVYWYRWWQKWTKKPRSL